MARAKVEPKRSKTRITFRDARKEDTSAILAMRTAAAERLLRDFGPGGWSGTTTQAGVLYTLRNAWVLVACDGSKVVGTLALWTKKPWAIDAAYFKKCKRPLYLTNMVVDPGWQRRGVGRAMLEAAQAIARSWPAEAIRLDAYEGKGGAGEFYARCGFTEVGRASYRTVPLIYYEWLS